MDLAHIENVNLDLRNIAIEAVFGLSSFVIDFVSFVALDELFLMEWVNSNQSQDRHPGY